MKRQRAESLAERELSLLPLIGHRRAEDLGGRVQVEFNLVAGSYLRPIGRARGASPFWAQKKLFSARKKEKARPFRAAKRIFAI